mmetsp:Transcript_47318/g.60784  ORF Transcript_47318/g.60784 Transcript_47318/m.60784 type:complete len:279 (+) Transcript_47318:63-899(+)
MEAGNSFDLTYFSANIEIIPAHIFGKFPNEPIRLVLSNYAPAIVMVSTFILYYFILVPLVFPALKPKAPSDIAITKSFRDAHNFTLFIYSGFCCFSTAIYLYQDGQLFDWHALMCIPVEGTWIRLLSATFTFSKLVEWIDTAFIVWLGNTPPQFLHKYHHATTFWLFCFVMNLPGPEKFGLLMNGGVHTLMYSHYWRSWPKPLVPLITFLQILQLSVVTYAWTVSPSECPNSRFASAPTDYLLEYLTPYAMVPVFLYLFVVFFAKRFIFKQDKRGKKV